VAVRKFTGNGIMKADEGTRFSYKGKKIYHFMVSRHGRIWPPLVTPQRAVQKADSV